MNENMRNRGRMAIYSMAGIYLLYMAYKLMDSISTSSGNQKILVIVFMIFFGVVGAAMVIMGVVKGYQLSNPSAGAASQETETEETPSEMLEDHTDAAQDSQEDDEQP